MQAQVSSTRTATGSNKQVLKALGGTMLALAVAAGVVLWQGTGRHEQQTASITVSQQTEPAAVEHAATVFGSSATPGQIHSATLGESSVIYIAGSEEQAAYLRRFAAEINALAVAAGQPASSITVLVAATPEDGARIDALIALMLDAQHSIGLSVSQVFDLRAG